MPRVAQPLSRTSSTTSVDSSRSSDDGLTPRRTRRRFTDIQLMMLESLFHKSSHPSRDERDCLARAGGMEPKSVTIWFQNKRQTERRIGMYNGHGRSVDAIALMHYEIDDICPPRPTLDRVASLTERDLTPPRSPSRHSRSHQRTIYDIMPSSPMAPPSSPPARDYVEYGKRKRSQTLEWACARERLLGKVSGKDVGFGDELRFESLMLPSSEKEALDRKLADAVKRENEHIAALALVGLGRDLPPRHL